MEFPESFIYAGPAFSAPEQPVPAPYFRRQFRLERVPEQAELLICGIGFYELYVNGQRITRGRLAPYISSPDVAVYYDSYDITPLLKIGENVLGVWLGTAFRTIRAAMSGILTRRAFAARRVLRCVWTNAAERNVRPFWNRIRRF